MFAVDVNVWNAVRRQIQEQSDDVGSLEFVHFRSILRPIAGDGKEGDDLLQRAFRAFDVPATGAIDSLELLTALALGSPSLTRSAKLRVLFELFNMSSYRPGCLSPDEAMLMLQSARRVLTKAQQGHYVAAMPPKQLENVVTAIFGANETLSQEQFVDSCNAAPALQTILDRLQDLSTAIPVSEYHS